MTAPTNEQLLEAANASPAAVGRGDRDGWVGLFARHGIIEDPVGSAPHHNGLYDPRTGVRGNGPIGRFFDTFIAPNDITFHIERDVVAPPFVVRDVTIELSMGAGVRARVPMHLRYEICEEEGALKIAQLCAHWELVPMVRQVLAQGGPGLRTMNRLGMRMLLAQGPAGILGFCRGLRGIHGAGKDVVWRFVDAANRRDAAAMGALFDPRAAGIGCSDDRTLLDAGAFCARFDGTLTATKLLSSGFVTSASCAVRGAGGASAGVGFFEFNGRTRRLHAVRLYLG